MLSTLDGTRQTPDSKLLPRSVYDKLTQISNDFQQSLYCFQCRHGVTLLLFRRRFPLVFIRHLFLSSLGSADVRHVHWWVLSPRIMSRHAPYCWLATSLFWYSAPTQFSKAFLKNTYPTFKCILMQIGILRARFTISLHHSVLKLALEISAEKACTVIFATHLIEYAFVGVSLSICKFMGGDYLN